MDHLERVSKTKEAAIYRVVGGRDLGIRRYVASTSGTREICNRPELLGCDFTNALGSAITSLLKTTPLREDIEGHPQSKLCVLNFLRGGLNFQLREALCSAFGSNTHSSAFMSSQRYKIDGRWRVQEDMYRKLRIPKDAIILTGDVVATGVTVANGLEVLFDHIVDIGASVRGFIFFTIGCQRLEEHLERFDARCREAFPNYRGASLVYLEGRFHLVDETDELRIGIPGTDLIRRESLLAPEFFNSQYDALSFILERCTIYDAGSRAFDIAGYVDDVIEYWQGVAALARDGLSLCEALEERWNLHQRVSRDEFLAQTSREWPDLDQAELEALWRRHDARWSGDFLEEAERSDALASLAQERIDGMRGTIDE